MIQLVGRFEARALPETLASRIKVFVGGDRVRSVAACHTLGGWVDCYQRDDRGRFVMMAGAARIVRRRGEVAAFVDRLSEEERRCLTAGLGA